MPIYTDRERLNFLEKCNFTVQAFFSSKNIGFGHSGGHNLRYKIDVALDSIGRHKVLDVEFPHLTVTDEFGSSWIKRCPECGEDSMQVVRPGKAQCSNCD